LVTAIWPGSARSGGFEYPEHGTAALARGGTFVARADDPTAILFNPAGVARLRGTHALLNCNVINENIGFLRRNYGARNDPAGLDVPPDRFRHDESLTMPEIKNDNAPFLTPFVAVTTDLGFLQRYNLTLMIGAYAPHVHPRRSYPRWCEPGTDPCVPSEKPTSVPAPSRYDVADIDVLVVYPTLGVAWRPLPNLSIGGNFQATYGSLDLTLAVGSIDNGEDPEFDTDVALETRDAFTPTGVVGVHYAPLSFLELGASVRFGFEFEFEGEVRADLPEKVKQMSAKVEPNPASMTLSIPMPWVVRAGARYVNHDGQDRERFDVELDFVWESTGQVDTFVVDTEAQFVVGTIRKSIETLSQEHAWDDSWSLRLGGAYRYHDLFTDGHLIFRLGGFYEAAAAPEAFSRLDFVPYNRYGITAGVGVKWGRYTFGVGYAYLFHERRELAPDGGDARSGACQSSGGSSGCGSAVSQLVPVDPEAGRPVGNGRFDVSIQLLTFGAAASFGG
jgi:long-chain fatty acid transport protein